MEAQMNRVLIVDNHTLFRQVLAVVLRLHTDLKESVQAGSLAEARWVLGGLDGKIDLAIVGLNIPDGNATELIKELRDAEPDVLILAFTIGRSFQLRARALEAGADQVLSTASSGEKMVRAVKKFVGR
jgi:DNA-binding NarL/FixJ family response regulator